MSRSLTILLLLFLAIANVACAVLLIFGGAWPIALLNTAGALFALHTLSNLE